LLLFPRPLIMTHQAITDDSKMTDEFIAKFQSWWKQAKSDPSLKHKGAMCVSTIDELGFPDSRFVDLKAATNEGFTFCTFLDSKKGVQIERCQNVALSMWWENVGYQVRVQGRATRISRSTASKYWKSRNRDAQLTTLCSKQSQPLVSGCQLLDQLLTLRASVGDSEIPVPDNWGGYIVAPVNVEFLTFKEDRLHLREQYLLVESGWQRQLLQP
jgi:pyridoxamine 5'-phosphate oxidase